MVKNSENDMDLFKKDVSKTKKKRHSTDGDSEEENKIKRNKEFLDKHIKDNSKLNSSAQRGTVISNPTINKQLLSTEASSNLTLKVLNSSSNMEKGTIIKINPNGIINETPELRNGKDGIIYFGYIPDPSYKEISTIDYNIPVTKNPTDKSDSTNM